jgi:hypothetical protein
MQAAEELVASIRSAVSRGDDAALDQAKQRLASLVLAPGGPAARETVERALRGELLEVRWELEEVLERCTPKAPEPKAPPKPEPPQEQEQDDMVLVYDDPRGLLLHRNRAGTRWFATQLDPRTGQPATFELPAQQVAAVKQQLSGSPYWVLGAGH